MSSSSSSSSAPSIANRATATSPPQSPPQSPPPPRKHPQGGAAWPDPLSEPHKGAYVDDISRLNAQRVERLLYPRSVDDIKAALSVAQQEGRQVSVRGTQVARFPLFYY